MNNSDTNNFNQNNDINSMNNNQPMMNQNPTMEQVVQPQPMVNSEPVVEQPIVNPEPVVQPVQPQMMEQSQMMEQPQMVNPMPVVEPQPSVSQEPVVQPIVNPEPMAQSVQPQVMEQPQMMGPEPMMNQNNMMNQQPMMQQPVYSQVGGEQPSSSDFISNLFKNKLFIIILGVVVVAIIVVVAISTGKNKNGKNDVPNNYAEVTNSNVFLLPGENGYYAIFDRDGKRLTDFIYGYVSGFNNGFAIVENDLFEQAVINADGKMIIDYGKYKGDMFSYGGLILVSSGNEKSFLDRNGKELYSNPGPSKGASFESTNLYVFIKKDNKLVLVRYDGKEVLTIDSSKDVEIDGEIENYMLFRVENNDNTYKHYIYDISKDEVYVSFDSKYKYSLRDYYGNEIFLLYSYEGGNAGKFGTIGIQNGVVITNEKEECDEIEVRSTGVYCGVGYEYYLFNKDLGKSEYRTFDSMVMGLDTYAVNTKIGSSYFEKGVDFYKDGQKVQSNDCYYVNDHMMAGKYYVLKNNNSYNCIKEDEYAVFDSDGNRINNLSFKNIYGVDKNNNVISGEDYYKVGIYDLEGNQLSKDLYSDIEIKNGYYEVRKAGYSYSKSKGIIDFNGNELVPTEYDYVKLISETNNKFAEVEVDDKKIIYDIENKKELVEVDSKYLIYYKPNYFYVSMLYDKTEKYYSYTTGELFHEYNYSH